METEHSNYSATAQKKYRRAQANRGLVRFELQVSAQSKAKFDEMVATVAREYLEPRGEKQRIAKARMQVFDEITQGTIHHFYELKEQIDTLREEVKALSPQFFQTHDTAPLPEAIRALPDDPKQLKAILAKLHKEAQQAKLLASNYKRKAEQYLKLYEVADDYTSGLKAKLESHGMLVDSES